MRPSHRVRPSIETLEIRVTPSASHTSLGTLRALAKDEPPGPPPPYPTIPIEYPRQGGAFYEASLKETLKHSTFELDYVWNNGAAYATRLTANLSIAKNASKDPEFRIYGDFSLVATELALDVAGEPPAPSTKGTIKSESLSYDNNREAFYTLVFQSHDGYTYTDTVTVASRAPHGLPDPAQFNVAKDLTQFSTAVLDLYPPPSP